MNEEEYNKIIQDEEKNGITNDLQNLNIISGAKFFKLTDIEFVDDLSDNKGGYIIKCKCVHEAWLDY